MDNEEVKSENGASAAKELSEMKGAFAGHLVRSNSKIKIDRAIAIAESTQMIYKREIEDIQMEIKQLRRDRESMLDLSPSSAISLVLASEFDAKDFVRRDKEMSLKLRDLEITLEISTKRYEYLFDKVD